MFRHNHDQQNPTLKSHKSFFINFHYPLQNLPRMQKISRRANNKKSQTKGFNALCCSCRLSVSSSSSSSSEESQRSGGFPAISSLSHAMVQERLDQIIRERQDEILRRETRDNNNNNRGNSKFIVMVAMEKCSYDPMEDFRESIQQMIVTNRIYDPKDLRRLLNCYVSMNSEESRGVILEAFHDVCSILFRSCKYH